MNDAETPREGKALQVDSGVPGAELFAPLLCLIGLCICAYLTALHYGILRGDLSLGRVCDHGRWGDCNSVVASRYGKLLGLPVAVWGMWYYICAGTCSLGIVMLRKGDAGAFLRALLVMTVTVVAFDAYLAWAMWWRLERICPLCIGTYAVNVAILVVALWCRHRLRGATGSTPSLFPSLGVLMRTGDAHYYREVLKTFLTGLATGGCLLVLAVCLIVSRSIFQAEKDRFAELVKYVGHTTPVEVPTADRPSRGPEDAVITLVVFFDFLCEQCKVAAEYFDIVAANHRDSLRLVYRHYPADATCNEHATGNMHPGACALALAADCAHLQGRFWAFHDVVFSEAGRFTPEKLTDYASRSGLNLEEFRACVDGDQAADAVRDDIALRGRWESPPRPRAT